MCPWSGPTGCDCVAGRPRARAACRPAAPRPAPPGRRSGAPGRRGAPGRHGRDRCRQRQRSAPSQPPTRRRGRRRRSRWRGRWRRRGRVRPDGARTHGPSRARSAWGCGCPQWPHPAASGPPDRPARTTAAAGRRWPPGRRDSAGPSGGAGAAQRPRPTRDRARSRSGRRRRAARRSRARAGRRRAARPPGRRRWPRHARVAPATCACVPGRHPAHARAATRGAVLPWNRPGPVRGWSPDRRS